MNAFIDILSRLIIATITFVAPMIIFCFGVFFDALKLNINQKKEKQKSLANEAILKMSETDIDPVAVIKEAAKKIDDSVVQRIKDFCFHPTFQIISIFSFLFISLGSIMFSHLVLDNLWKLYSYNLWKFLIWASFIAYSLAVIFIVVFVINVISMKSKVEKNKK